MWLGITNIWTYVLGTMIIILLPGPNSMYVLATAARRGVRTGYKAACGVFLGDGIIMFLSAAGVASLLHTEPVLFDIVKYSGAAYLCYIGYGLLRRAWSKRANATRAEVDPAAEVEQIAMDERNPFRRALTVSLLNPKAILFFVSFFIQFVSPHYPYPALSFVILGVIAEVISCVYLTTLIFAGSYLAAQFRARRRLARGLTTGVAAIFIGFAVRLATASLS
jgi:leucine efflux protein